MRAAPVRAAPSRWASAREPAWRVTWCKSGVSRGEHSSPSPQFARTARVLSRRLSGYLPLDDRLAGSHETAAQAAESALVGRSREEYKASVRRFREVINKPPPAQISRLPSCRWPQSLPLQPVGDLSPSPTSYVYNPTAKEVPTSAEAVAVSA